MALSLDVIGKFVLMLVALAVAVGLIVNFAGDISPPGLPDDGAEFPQSVEIADSPERVADLVTQCYDASRERRHESFTCFVAHTESGNDFSVAKTDVQDELSPTVNASTSFSSDTYDGAVIEIGWSVDEQAVRVTE